ncbi:YggS family pyridoxal phosphate-dependent enzyme [Hyphobacterium sp. CCMP332]|nr:YggS family pyridoxal phosphate-dependent enzyme [Hyphobacterium sp. CCMP332]
MTQKEEIAKNIQSIKKENRAYKFTLVAVSKTKPNEFVMEAYNSGQRDFGENKVQELLPKFEELPKDILWHFIGHLQRNKVKLIIPFVHLIHSVDSLRLMKEINKQALKEDKIIDCLLQLFIAKEETKYGLDEDELKGILDDHLEKFKNVNVKGLMGMATFTEDQSIIDSEFRYLKEKFDAIKKDYTLPNLNMDILSMGMSHDYQIALKNGSNMLRIGSTIFGARN